MDQIEKHIHKIFLGGAVLAILASFSRADYNLPLYVFAYAIWSLPKVNFVHGME